MIKIATPIFVRPKLAALKMGVPLLALAAIILAPMPERLTEVFIQKFQRVISCSTRSRPQPTIIIPILLIGEVFDVASL